MNKIFFLMLALMAAGCASTAHKHGRAKVVYTALNTVSDRGPYTINELIALSHQEVLLEEKRVASLAKALEGAKIGKSTLHERKQLEGAVYIAVFLDGETRWRPKYISDGCHVLDLETDDLHQLDRSIAVNTLGVPTAIYEARLCKEPGLGITLSPRSI